MKNLIIIGAGGYAKSVIDSINLYEYKFIGFIDDYKSETEHLGYPILGKSLESITNLNDYCYFVAIGNNDKRKQWFDKLVKNNLEVINVIDKTAIISQKAQLGIGCFVGKMAIINSCVKIGNNCIVNTKALIEHGCNVCDNTNISTNTVLNGDVKVKESSFIGSCSVINGQVNIGSRVIVGSGSVVIKDVEDLNTVVGVPARVIKVGGKMI